MSRDPGRRPDETEGDLGAGGEAAEGVHGVGGRDPSDRSAREGEVRGNPEEQPGSQPVRGRTYEHKGGYGGEGGKPRT